LKKLFIVILTAGLLTGCGYFQKAAASLTGYSNICVAGVSYLQFPSGVTVEYTKDGKIKQCNN